MIPNIVQSHLACSSELFARHTLPHALERMSSLGFQCVDLHERQPSGHLQLARCMRQPATMDALVLEIVRADLSVDSLSLDLDGRPDLDEGRARRQHMEQLSTALEIARRLSADIVAVKLGNGQRELRRPQDWLAAVSELADEAERSGRILALEIVAQSLVPDVASALRIKQHHPSLRFAGAVTKLRTESAQIGLTDELGSSLALLRWRAALQGAAGSEVSDVRGWTEKIAYEGPVVLSCEAGTRHADAWSSGRARALLRRWSGGNGTRQLAMASRL